MLPVWVKWCINLAFNFKSGWHAVSLIRIVKRCCWLQPRSCPLPCKHGPAASWEGVWMLLSEDVANSAAGDDLQASATLPHPKRDLWTHRRTITFLRIRLKVWASCIIYCRILAFSGSAWMFVWRGARIKAASEGPVPFWVTLPSPEKHESFCLFPTTSLLHSEQSMRERQMLFFSIMLFPKRDLLCTVWFSPLSTGHKHVPINSVIVWDQLAPGRLHIISFAFITFLKSRPGWALVSQHRLERPY